MRRRSRLDAGGACGEIEKPDARVRRWGIVLVSCGVLAIATWAEQATKTVPPQPTEMSASGAPADAGPEFSRQMEERRNNERQRALEADTDKLLRLAQQLHDEVAKTNKDELSVSVIKTSGEIEKLAKSVREKMRGY